MALFVKDSSSKGHIFETKERQAIFFSKVIYNGSGLAEVGAIRQHQPNLCTKDKLKN